MSIDRLIPENGYVKENIVLCIYKANTVKNDLTLSELKEWIPSWYKKIERKLKMNSFEYLACAPPHCKCSKLKYHNGVVEIEDDYGNTICIPEHEMTLISEKWIKEINNG